MEGRTQGPRLTVNAKVRRVLNDCALLPFDSDALDDDADLYVAGMTSYASVAVLLELEDAFQVEFPAQVLDRGVLQSISAIAATIRMLQADPSARAC